MIALYVAKLKHLKLMAAMLTTNVTISPNLEINSSEKILEHKF